TMISENTTITLMASLNGETAECSFELQLVNTSDLMIERPQHFTEDADSNGDFILEDSKNLATVTGACGAFNILQEPPAGTVVRGDTTITFTVVDSNDNQDECTFQINITGAENPEVSCKPAFVYLDASGNGTLHPEDIFDGDPN